MRLQTEPRHSLILIALIASCGLHPSIASAGGPGAADTLTAGSSEKSGSLGGRVEDVNKRPLPGASVVVDPGGIAVVTNSEGYYVVTGLAPGTYRVEVQYIGLQSVTSDASIAPSQATRLDVTLSKDTRVSEEVVVTAPRALGEAEALNQRKSSENILNVLPQEVITSLPNANLADALGRLPSVSLERDEGEGKFVQIRGLPSAFTNVTINGVQIPSVSGSNEGFGRQVKLDAFPSDLVGSVQLYKTTSPDQEGDSIGGTVNVVNKAAGDEEYFNVNALGGYTDIIGGRPSYQVSGTYSNRFGDDKALGFIFGGTYDWNGRGINDVEPNPTVVTTTGGQTVNTFDTYDVRDYRYDRSRWGLAGGLDYRTAPNSTLFLKGFYNQFQNYGDRWVLSPQAGNFITPNLTDATGNYSASVQDRRPNEQTYSLVLGGNNDLHSVLIDYAGAYSHARQNRIGQEQANFDGPQNVAFSVNPGDGLLPQLTPLGGVNPYDPSGYTLTKFTRSYETSAAHDASGTANVTVPFSIGAYSSFLKVGGKYRVENKDVVTADRTWDTNGSLPYLMSQGVDSFTDPGYYFGHYTQGPNASLAAVHNFFTANQAAFDEDVNGEHLDNDPNNFTVNEKIAAGYLMDTTSFGPVDLMLGVRVEHTDAHYTGFIVTTDADGNWVSTTPISGGKSYTNPLPTVSMRWALDPQTNLRAVWAWHVGRPDYGLLPPSRVVNTDKNEIDAGNPDLKAQKAQSYDLLFEHFLGTVGLVSAGGFYKNLDDPIYPGSASTIHGGPFDGYTLIKPVNGPHAWIYGFEVAWQQYLRFLPGVLSGLGVAANYTYTHSRAEFDPSTGRTGTALLERTTPHEYNVGLTYDAGAFSGRAAVTYNSATIWAYNYVDGADGGLKGPNGDIYLYPHLQVDLQLTYNLPNGLTLLASGLNLNNEVFGFYRGSSQFNIQREFYSPTFAVGVRLAR